MRFELPKWLVVVPFVVLLVAAAAWQARRRRLRAAAGWSAQLGRQAAAMGSHSTLVLGLIALVAALGLAGPRWGRASQATESRALNVVVVMDISRSMLAQDVKPDRLTRAVGIARRLVQDLEGDRLALVAFAARGYLLSPLTLDQSALALQLDALDPEVVSEGGSGLGAAISQAAEVLKAATQGGDKAVVVFSDGESFEGAEALTSVGESLQRAGITLVLVPVGGSTGARIPDPDGTWHKDADGQEVITVRRDDLLKAAATGARGIVVPADAPDPSGEVRRVLDRLARAPAEDRSADDLIPRAWLFALVAAVGLLGHTLTRRSAALVGLLLAVGIGTASAQRPSAGGQLLQRGDTAKAREAFAAEAKRLGTDSAWFNAGTAALVAGDMVAAQDALRRASLSLDPDLRRRALYNLGTAYLTRARRETKGRDSLLVAASRQLQSALQLAPGDADAKFNYELARRLMPPPPPPQSGGGGDYKKPPPKPQQPQQAPPTPGGMSKADAEQVLSAMERAERETRMAQAKRQRRGQPPLGPDW
ncbi:MAG: VWA domain-containing protein [Gemmatimonadales bacterium]|nr:VWA domain-containing protein [Gemmatimonadales bacterium]